MYFIPSSTEDIFAQTPTTTTGGETIVQSSRSQLQFFWNGFEDESGIEHFEYRVSSNTYYITDWTGVTAMDHVTLNYLNLMDGQIYVAEVRAVNVGQMKSNPINSTILIESRAPKLTGKSYVRGSKCTYC